MVTLKLCSTLIRGRRIAVAIGSRRTSGTCRNLRTLWTLVTPGLRMHLMVRYIVRVILLLLITLIIGMMSTWDGGILRMLSRTRMTSSCLTCRLTGQATMARLIKYPKLAGTPYKLHLRIALNLTHLRCRTVRVLFTMMLLFLNGSCLVRKIRPLLAWRWVKLYLLMVPMVRTCGYGRILKTFLL